MKNNIASPVLRNITITDTLFSHYVRLVPEKIIPYQWEVLNDRAAGTEKSGCINNFRIAAGELSEERTGAVFSDSDAYKWLETLAYCLESGYGKKYEKTADELIDLIGRAQRKDGYINTYYSILHPDKKWTNLAEGHELYCGGHLIEAAVAYYRATGKSTLLDIAKRFADLICREFSGENDRRCPGHQEIELALIKLCRVTGERRYAELAAHFIRVRGSAPNYLIENLRAQGKDRIFPEFADYDAGYAQSHLPAVQQTTAEGHAVRAMYMYSAMADIAKEFDDEGMKNACRVLWKNVTERRMYITGGIGSSGHLERFTTDYDLPNDRMYCESCASIGLMMFGKRMAELTGNAAYHSAVERALFNTVLAGISEGGDRYFYVNPLEVWPENCIPSTSMSHVKAVRQPWFACACCPPNIARTLAALGAYIYAQDERSVYINQFISSEFRTNIRGVEATFRMDARYVPDGRTELTIETNIAGSFTVRIRMPEYLKEPQFEFAGREISPVTENGYAVLAISCAGTQKLIISGTVRPEFVFANTNVHADAGKTALTFGPFVYCLEQADNGSDLPSVFADIEDGVKILPPDPVLPGNLPLLAFEGLRLESGVSGLYVNAAPQKKKGTFRAVPYALWCNREPGEMTVWVPYLI